MSGCIYTASATLRVACRFESMMFVTDNEDENYTKFIIQFCSLLGTATPEKIIGGPEMACSLTSLPQRYTIAVQSIYYSFIQTSQLTKGATSWFYKSEALPNNTEIKAGLNVYATNQQKIPIKQLTVVRLTTACSGHLIPGTYTSLNTSDTNIYKKLPVPTLDYMALQPSG